jgi:phosphopantothenoylcysteine decarboxylase/phosphopantothenate--cysteine ligase
MGFAVADRAAARGAEVTLVAGPTALVASGGAGLRRIDVRSATDMRAALWEALGTDLSKADALVMAAAVADYRPAQVQTTKIKKADDRVSIELVRNPDLVAEVGAARRGPRPVLVAFAVETGSADALVGYARGKLEDKRVDLVVANDASAFAADDSQVTFVTRTGAEPTGRLSKLAIADALLDRVRALCS